MFKQDGIWEKFKQNIFDKENYINITLISALIGGGFQVIFLWSIGIFYLRFFSITQMISDTIAILFPLFIILIFVFGAINWYFSIFRRQGFLGVIAVLIGSGIGAFISHKSIDTLIKYIFIGVIIVLVILILAQKNKILSIIKETKENILINIIQFILFIIFFLILLSICYLIKNHFIHNIFISPDNFMNQNYICKNLAKNKCNIRYFNDKYIFVERENNKIEIIKFDNFFQK